MNRGPQQTSGNEGCGYEQVVFRTMHMPSYGRNRHQIGRPYLTVGYILPLATPRHSVSNMAGKGNETLAIPMGLFSNRSLFPVNSQVVNLGVVLFQLGGPDSLESIEPFLYNLFCDPDIIDFPFARIARQPLARLISSRRAKHVAHHYAEIGGKSPILENTVRQAAALEAELRRTMDARVVVAMRYWHPFTAEAIGQLEQFAPGELVLLPLYPQYSRTTTGSSLNEWSRNFRPNGWNPRVHSIEHFHEDPAYLESVVETVNRSMAGFADPRDVDVIFSAHSLPVAVIEKGDPYQRHIERTVELVWQRGGWPGRRHLCYQSKVGASKWLVPSMHETVRRLAAEQRRHVLTVPISFVSDHVETLHEIDIEHREQARGLGIEDYHMTPGLNDSPSFIQALAGLVRGALPDA
jgi:ferrochelatase